MNIILATILLTLLGAGLVVLLVWLSVVSCRSIKFKKKVKAQLDGIRKRMDESDQSLSSSINDLYKNIQEISDLHFKNLEEYKKQTNLDFEELHRGLLSDIQIELNECVKSHNKLEKSTDSRFDKLYNTIKEKE